jgi:hypothetical protein
MMAALRWQEKYFCAAWKSNEYKIKDALIYGNGFRSLKLMSIMNLQLLVAHWALLAGQATCQRISEVLSTRSELSSLVTLINSIPSIADQLAIADKFTFLAATNDALSTWLARNNSRNDIRAMLEYHLLNGTHKPPPQLLAIPVTDSLPFLCQFVGREGH